MTVGPTPGTPTEEVPPTPPARRGWTAGRIVSLVIGSVLGLSSLGLLGVGALATWATNTQRDAAGYLTSGVRIFSTPSYAVTSDRIDLGSSTESITPGDVFGTVRIRATSADPAKDVFLGVAPQDAVDTYLTGVDHLVVTNWVDGHASHQLSAGHTLTTAPTDTTIWTAHVTGKGTQTLTWQPSGGHWVVVVMNANGGAGVSVTADVGATVPDLGWIAVGLFAAGGILLAVAVTMIAVSATRASS